MEVVIRPSAAEVGSTAAEAVVQTVRRRPDAVLGLATGSSPVSVYDRLGELVAAREVSLARCRAFLLDEYVGLPAGHPQAYRSVIERDFVAKVDIDPAAVRGPDGAASDLQAACAAYEAAIDEAGGIDVQLLGIGSDGHIAFNEPGSSLGSLTRIKTLTPRTRADNARFFNGDPEAVPGHCLTQGIGTIRRARHLVLVATGERKAQAVHAMVEGPVSAMCPASALQLHPHVTVVLDDAAAVGLERAQYYRETLAAKPDWQGW